MKIGVMSDLHLEQYLKHDNLGFNAGVLENEKGVDVLILAGDIMDMSVINLDKTEEFFSTLSSNHDRVFYVMGNHEHYLGDFATTESRLKEKLLTFGNINLLEKEGVTHKGKRFFGGTKWTSMRDGNPLVMFNIKKGMNDYYWIKNSSQPTHYRTKNKDGSLTFHTRESKLVPGDVYDDHLSFMEKLKCDVKEHSDKDFVLVTHHTPSFQFCSKSFYYSDLNDAYHDDMDWLFHDNSNIKAAFCGHTHGRKRVTINNAEVVLNARGYPQEGCWIDYEVEVVQL